jgi:23S rRNA pseudouridine2457 synthase
MEKAGQARQEGLGLTEERSRREDKRYNVKRMPNPHTLAFNKPYGVLPCFTDAQGRPTLAYYLKIRNVYAAGRLDMDSEGLMLLTSDGALAHHITDPQHKLPKVYLAQVERVPSDEALEQLRRGVLLNGKRTRPAEVQLLSEAPNFPDRPVPIRFRKSVPTTWLRITLREGLNRQVRRMTAAVGHPTLRLIRIAIGPIVLGELKPGQWRELIKREIVHMGDTAQSLGRAPLRRTKGVPLK